MKTRTHIEHLAEDDPASFELMAATTQSAQPIALPAVCRECDHLETEGDPALGYPPLCGLVLNSLGQACAGKFHSLLRARVWPDDPRCPGRNESR